MSDSSAAGSGSSALVSLALPAPDRPLLLTGLASALVLSGAGEVALPRETRGGSVEWGGAYAQGIRLTGPWRVSGRSDGVEYSLSSSLYQLEATRWNVESVHQWGPVRVLQELIALPRAPGVARRLTFTTDRPITIEIGSEFAPFLAPVLVEGVKPYRYHLRTRDRTITAVAHSYGVGLDSDPLPDGLWVNGEPWIGGSFQGEVESIRTRYSLDLLPDIDRSLTWVVWGGLASVLEQTPTIGTESLSVGPSLSALALPPWRDWLALSPQLAFPQDPPLERAYDLARGALRALYTRPDSTITGLVAGYPWYSALWCRDLAWMLPAVLWMGDPGWAEASIDTVLRFQAPLRIPLLGAETGELPMQISPGPVFLYGTSDTSLYYPELARRLVAHTGRLDAVRAWWPHFGSIARWADGKCSATSGLLANGGEVSELRDASVSIGDVHFGFDAVDTTIWDSTDRRDHAIDVQVLHHQALRALVDLGNRLGHEEDSARWTLQAQRIATELGTRYLWGAEGYLFDSLRIDGTPVQKLRPNALRVVSAGLLPLERARPIVERASRPDLSTAWGVRTLSDRDPGFDPQAYHDGQVWTIATAWAADAAFAVGDVARGMAYLHQNADRIIEENGLANECYRGDAPTAFDSCFLLGFSIAPFLSILFERVWGLTVDASRGVLSIRPQFPEGWRSASLHHLRVGVGYVDLDWIDGALAVSWGGPGSLEVDVPGASARIDPGDRTSLPLLGRQPS